MSNAEITGAAREYRELQAQIKQLQDEAETIKAIITAEMDRQGIQALEADIFTVHWTAYTSSRVDTTALKQELPDVSARYTRTTEARRFQVA